MTALEEQLQALERDARAVGLRLTFHADGERPFVLEALAGDFRLDFMTAPECREFLQRRRPPA